MIEDVRSDNDDLLNRATAALRDLETPAGPPPALMARTLGALRASAGASRSSSSSRFRIGPSTLWRVAAAIVLASGIAIVAVVYFSNADPGKLAKLPPTQPVPSKGAPDLTPGPVIVQNHAPGGTFPPLSHKLTPAPDRPVQVVAMVTSPGIRGTVFFDGPAPELPRIDMSIVKECALRHPQGGLDQRLLVQNGRLANAVISIEVPENVSFDFKLPDGPVFLDQMNCQYEPHMLAAMVGQELIVKNSDPFLHNVHALPADNPTFNFGQPTIDFGRKVLSLSHPERFQVRCDIHPWMSAWVYVFDNPFFAVSRPDGSFEIPPGLPDGTYKVVAWHELLGTQLGQVTIDRGTGSTAFTFLALQAQGKNAGEQVAVKESGSRIAHCENCLAGKN